MTVGPLELLSRIADLLDALGIPYALGGSLASSLFGTPRSTVDIDIAVDLPNDRGEALLQAAAAEFYVPLDAARGAISASTSFNLVDTANGMKVDLFVLGDGPLDRIQIERRVRVVLPGLGREIWVTSPEVQVLRKLDWYRSTGMTSERQWSDAVGLLDAGRDTMDLEQLERDAAPMGLGALLQEALKQAARRD